MNTIEPESENKLSIATRSQSADHAFDWPDDQQDSSSLDPDVTSIQGRHVSNWWVFWFATWTGTTAMGALFGGVLGLFGAVQDPTFLVLGLLYGGLWAGVVGLFVFVHVAAICWMFWWLGRPLVPAVIAGMLTGAICGMVFFSIVTAPLGAVGAYVAGHSFLKSTQGKKFLTFITTAQNQSLGPLSFSMMDLLLRVTVLAVFIAGWTAWLKSF